MHTAQELDTLWHESATMRATSVNPTQGVEVTSSAVMAGDCPAGADAPPPSLPFVPASRGSVARVTLVALVTDGELRRGLEVLQRVLREAEGAGRAVLARARERC